MVLGGPAQPLVVYFWGGQLGGTHGIRACLETGQTLAFALDFTLPHTTRACLKKGIAVDELGNGSWSHRYFSGVCRACRVLQGAVVCWCQHTSCPIAPGSGVLDCGECFRLGVTAVS